MFPIYQNAFSKLIAAAATLVAFATVCPAAPADQAQKLGPVSAYEPILTTVGSKRVIAFFLPEAGHCALHAVVWDNSNADPGQSATRMRVSLEPGQIVHIDTAEQRTLNLQCGANADKLAIVDADATIAFGIPPGEPLKASASGF
jgi:hypothetical protein